MRTTVLVVGLLLSGAACLAADRPSTQPAERAKLLKANLEDFRLDLLYHGPEEKPFYRLILSVPKVEVKAVFFYEVVHIDQKQAAAIIDHLEGLQRVLNGDAARRMGVLMDRLGMSAKKGASATQPAAGAKAPSLPEALEQWIAAIEKDDPKAASRWAKDEAAARQLAENWDRLKANHKQYDYRKWLENRTATEGNPIREMHPGGAEQIGDATKFKVGGHSFGHLHIDWEKLDTGWRIVKVWGCR